MVGGGDRDHKFVAKILHQLGEGATTLYAVDDSVIWKESVAGQGGPAPR